MQSSVAIPDLEISEVDRDYIPTIRRLNRAIFNEHRIINSLESPGLLMTLAQYKSDPVGFKVGYAESDEVFYSAKGGVLPGYRRKGIARYLLYDMIERAREQGFDRFAYETMPNRHPGMTILGLNEGFELVATEYSTLYEDYLLRFEKHI